MQIDIGEVVIDARNSLEKVVCEGRGEGEREKRPRKRKGKENRFAQSAFVGIHDLMD